MTKRGPRRRGDDAVSTIRAAARTVEATLAASDLLPLPKAAAIAGVSDTYLRLLVQRGTMPGVQIGRNYYVPAAAARTFKRQPGMGRPLKNPPKSAKK